MIKISVQGKVANRNQWMDLATKVERQGFHGLYVADHRGSTASPFVALAAAATLTERITLGTCVLNAGAWSPMALATEAVTLDASPTVVACSVSVQVTLPQNGPWSAPRFPQQARGSIE